MRLEGAALAGGCLGGGSLGGGGTALRADRGLDHIKGMSEDCGGDCGTCKRRSLSEYLTVVFFVADHVSYSKLHSLIALWGYTFAFGIFIPNDIIEF